jgi:methyltransferase
MLYFIVFIILLIALRLGELVIAKRNETWIRAKGAVEYGQKHYPFMVLLHTCFIASLIVEYVLKKPTTIHYFLLVAFILLILIKIQVIRSLGYYWNTKILRIEGVPLIKKGLYKYFKHPNYVIVVCEIAVIPLIFQLYITALVFSLLNAIMLSVRITEENKIIGQ